ncbi:inositol monophosphatase family protein [Desulfobacterium sp. N47]|uniref:Inositol-1-monophosphatase n=1 Tax=uncultured Desulfobacterium sp. TaxID=201089 RepID=E1YI85_9BACT|nr:Inositol-1-monophosphatase [uncultured Desulfobacterium sp.]
MNINLIKRIGIAAAYKGGEVLKENFDKIPKIKKKGSIDLVTESDTESEKLIIETIKKVFPSHTILAEESGLENGDAECLWIIDPLDGTTNFAHHLPIFAVSIAFALNGDIVAGIVLNPVTGELFTATKGEGANLNGIPIHVSKTQKLTDSLLVTGIPYNFKEIIDDIQTRFFNCLKASQGVRRLGSAALDLCYTAAGRFEGFFEQDLKPWDTAAGLIIAKEAGGSVTDFSGNSFDIYKPEILATNGKIHDEMIKLLELKG